ncbi:hypothetical protein HID58_022947 [Brassica napus]|uniref:Uncharacterized protein n=1 Tax=Brassica napus TaxID=3708 RepID=A0ABQ8D0Q0_BRANA|nr:hypothetical protein HID58_022947 [Brassica napus]
MVNSCILLAELKAVCCTNIAEVLMLTFWEARHIKKGGKLMGVDMLLLDEKSMLIEGSVNVNRHLPTPFQSIGGLTSNGADRSKLIPTEHFGFCNHEQLLSLANTNRQLPYSLRI